nr:RCC1 domain-containing protein 1 isoform X1 [Anolis sagrei ordinatus]
MAAPWKGAWFRFGFGWEAWQGPEATLEPQPLGQEEEGAVLRVRPGWSLVALTAAEGSVELRGFGGGASLQLPGDCVAALPGEGHVVLARKAALEAWAVRGAGKGRRLELDPHWRRPLAPTEALGLARQERQGGGLPLVPGGFVVPRPPFFHSLPASLRARHLVLGHEHVLLLDEAGTLFSWGSGRHGQLGHGDLESRLEPQAVEALQGVALKEVAAGGWHSAAVSEAGDLYLWGWNESGQLGLPSKAAAESQRAARDTDSTGLSSGDAQPRGPPGADFISIQAFPALLDLPQEAEALKAGCGSRHTAVVTRTGELYTWGWGQYGQLGHGDTASLDQPRRVDRFVEWGLSVLDVTCGPWATFVQVRRPEEDQGLSGAQAEH